MTDSIEELEARIALKLEEIRTEWPSGSNITLANAWADVVIWRAKVDRLKRRLYNGKSIDYIE